MKRNNSDNRDSTNEQPFSHYYVVDRNSWILFLWKEVEDMKTDDV